MVELESRIRKELDRVSRDDINDYNKVKLHTLNWVLEQIEEVRKTKEEIKHG